ncbi:mpv17-like protein 2 [Diadema antillarum]|uniref:mpv17-like protein 2 n=2 Tax=Diadema antillarum TaxID=105358 RepID=UPI003A8556BB
MFMVVRDITRKLFSPKYLVWTNIFSGAGLLMLGDGIEQYREILKERKVNKIQTWNFKRSAHMFTLGAMLGPFNHYWYVYLDRILPGTMASTVVRKIVLDELIGSPILITLFFLGLGTLDGKPLDKSVDLVKDKFVTVYMCDLCCWPAIQWINFYYLPPHLRVIYINVVTLAWDTFMSYIVFDYKEHDKEKKESKEVLAEESRVREDPCRIVSTAPLHSE